jgi:hypothetical protein
LKRYPRSRCQTPASDLLTSRNPPDSARWLSRRAGVPACPPTSPNTDRHGGLSLRLCVPCRPRMAGRRHGTPPHQAPTLVVAAGARRPNPATTKVGPYTEGIPGPLTSRR